MVPSFILIDKPLDLTSHDVVQHVRKAAHIKQVGHTGTLDPFATGLLIILLDKATRLTQFLHELPKTYEATITLGATSDTDDLTGVITPVASPLIPSLQQVTKTLQKFMGTQSQIPPIYSAIKKGGQKLYDLARAGKISEALAIAGEQPRSIKIYALELLDYTYPEIKVCVRCSTGTYIRALGRDVGVELQTGAYVSALRRTEIGNLLVKQSIKLDELKEGSISSIIKPIEELLYFLPWLVFSADNVAKLKQGRTIEGEQAMASEQPLVLLDEQRKIFGVGVYDSVSKALLPRVILNTTPSSELESKQ